MGYEAIATIERFADAFELDPAESYEYVQLRDALARVADEDNQ